MSRNVKSLFASKTFWVNLVTALVALLQSQGLVQFVSAETLMMIVGVLNIVLRLLTTEPVSVTGKL